MIHTLIVIIVILVLLVVVLAVLLGIFVGRHYFRHSHRHHSESHVDIHQEQQRTVEEEREGTAYGCNHLDNNNDIVIGSDTSALREERRQRRWQQQQEHLHDEVHAHESHVDEEEHSYRSNNSNTNNREDNEIISSATFQPHQEHSREYTNHDNTSHNDQNDDFVTHRIEMHNHEPALMPAVSDSANTNMTPRVVSTNTINDANRHAIHSQNSNNSNHIENMESNINSNNNNNIVTSNQVQNDNEDHAAVSRYSPMELPGVAIENRIRPRSHLPKGTVVVEHDDRQYIIHFSEIEEIPQAAPPPLTAEELSFMEAARHRIASPEFYGRAEYLHASHCSSVHGVPLRRNGSAASLASLSAYDSSGDNFNKSINRSNNAHVHQTQKEEGSVSMTSEHYKAWHALHAPYLFHNYNEDGGDNKSLIGARSNGSIASLANYSFRPASQAGSLYRAEDSLSSHSSKAHKRSANKNKHNQQNAKINDNIHISENDERIKQAQETNARNVENFIRKKQDDSNESRRRKNFCVSHANEEIRHNNAKDKALVNSSSNDDNNNDDEEDDASYKSSCCEDNDINQRAQDAFMRHQQMRLAYYTDPARHQHRSKLYNATQYTSNSNQDAKSRRSNDKKLTKQNNSNIISKSNVMQEFTADNNNNAKSKNNVQKEIERSRRKRLEAYESTSDDMEDNNNNNNNREIEQRQRTQLLRRQRKHEPEQSLQTQKGEITKEHYSHTSFTTSTNTAQQGKRNTTAVTTTDDNTINNKERSNNNNNEQYDASDKYNMTIIAPMLNDGSNAVVNSHNGTSIKSNQRYVLPLTALGLEQITHHTLDNDQCASSKLFSVPSALPASLQMTSTQTENMNSTHNAADKLQQSNTESNNQCTMTTTAVVPLSEVIIVPATAAPPSLSYNELSANNLAERREVQGTPNVNAMNGADVSITHTTKKTSDEEESESKDEKPQH